MTTKRKNKECMKVAAHFGRIFFALDALFTMYEDLYCKVSAQ